ncbi:MAG: exo-alpha-sialidase [Planctomycetes bacterium]|nr:exo-alpha-sialidase [Planctomycetota bacterium]
MISRNVRYEWLRVVVAFVALGPGAAWVRGEAGRAQDPVSVDARRARTTLHADGIERSDLFVSGRDGYTAYRIPAMVVTTRGTVLAMCEGRKASFSDAGHIPVYLTLASAQSGLSVVSLRYGWVGGRLGRGVHGGHQANTFRLHGGV